MRDELGVMGFGAIYSFFRLLSLFKPPVCRACSQRVLWSHVIKLIVFRWFRFGLTSPHITPTFSWRRKPSLCFKIWQYPNSSTRSRTTVRANSCYHLINLVYHLINLVQTSEDLMTHQTSPRRCTEVRGCYPCSWYPPCLWDVTTRVTKMSRTGLTNLWSGLIHFLNLGK